MTTPGLRIMICAFEPSGDALGAGLMRALSARRQGIGFCGCGGALMAAEGLESLLSIAPFAVIGPGGALGAVPAGFAAVNTLAAAARDWRPAAVILIDSWTLSKAAAKAIRKAAPEVRLYKYVAPQVWASRPRRAKAVADLFDGVLCLFDFEPDYFTAHDARAVAVGHPGFQAAFAARIEGAQFRAARGIGDAPLLAIAPGSRRGELKRMRAPFREAAARILAAMPDTRIAVAAAPSVETLLPDWLSDWPGAPLIVPHNKHPLLYAAADAALAASGTVVTEIAARGTPVVVGYIVDPLTEVWARHVLTTPYVSLPNIAAGAEIVPEFLQQRCTGDALAGALIPMLKGERDGEGDAVAAAVRRLAGDGPPAADAAAETVLRWLAEDRRLTG